MSNNVNRLDYPYGYYRFYWNQSYTCVTSQCNGKQRGTYGYYRWYTYGTLGDASSDNQGLYFQDSWRVNRHLTLNLGLRAEREFLPSFSKEGIAAAPPIEFGWGKKISPRVGFAWDPQGNGKMRLYGSYGEFYDVMKYEMPRGSFGGDIYLTYYYALDDPTLFNTLRTYGYPSDPSKLPGRFFEGINWRIPSNDPNDSTVDPKLKPMKQRMLDLGYDFSINPTLVASVRYTNRRLIRTIEDVGTLTPEGRNLLYCAIRAKVWLPIRPTGSLVSRPPRRRSVTTTRSRFALTSALRGITSSRPPTPTPVRPAITPAWRVRMRTGAPART